MEYRNESKYIVDQRDIIALEYKLKNVISYDEYSNKKKYNVRSIYFDSLDDKCFHDNENGSNPRFKLRIRIYNCSSKDIKLEYKYKKNGFVKKSFCYIDKKICSKLLNNKMLNYSECTNSVLKKLYIEQRINSFMPKVIVEYDRIALVDKIGNTRITFDMNIRASKYFNYLFKDNILARPILDSSKSILEIKYDEFLPDYISNLIKIKGLKTISFSKYYLSRLAFEEEVL